LSNNDFDKLFAIKKSQGKNNLTGNEFAKEILEGEINRLHFNRGRADKKEQKNVTEYKHKLNFLDTTTYVILEQEKNTALLKRFTGDNLDPTPYVIASGITFKENNLIEWNSGQYFDTLGKANGEYFLLNAARSAKEFESGEYEIEGHIGEWYIIDNKEYNGEKLYLMEHTEFGDEAACLIVDKDMNVKLDDVWNGFDDYDEFLLPLIMSTRQSEEGATVTIYQTEDRKRFSCNKLQNEGAYDEWANCTSSLYELPKEFQSDNILGILSISNDKGNEFEVINLDGKPVLLDLSAFAESITKADVEKFGISLEKVHSENINEEEKTMEFKVTVTPIEKHDSKTKGYANVVFDNCFAVNGIKIMEGSKGLFVAYPNYKNGDEYKNICNPTTADMKTKLETAVLEKYKEKTQALSQAQSQNIGR